MPDSHPLGKVPPLPLWERPVSVSEPGEGAADCMLGPGIGS